MFTYAFLLASLIVTLSLSPLVAPRFTAEEMTEMGICLDQPQA